MMKHGNYQTKNQHSKTKNNQNQNESYNWRSNWKDIWITQAPDEQMIQFADEAAEKMKNKELTTSQIRNFFSEVIRIKENGILKNRTEFLMLKPKIAYAAKRSGKKGAEIFKDIMTKAIELVMQAENDDTELEKRFKNFHALFEAILAYHKVHGGW